MAAPDVGANRGQARASGSLARSWPGRRMATSLPAKRESVYNGCTRRRARCGRHGVELTRRAKVLARDTIWAEDGSMLLADALNRSVPGRWLNPLGLFARRSATRRHTRSLVAVGHAALAFPWRGRSCLIGRGFVYFARAEPPSRSAPKGVRRWALATGLPRAPPARATSSRSTRAFVGVCIAYSAIRSSRRPIAARPRCASEPPRRRSSCGDTFTPCDDAPLAWLRLV
jgi:hypothetical protein